MYISKLKIQGYKSFDQEFSIEFNSDLTILIGENGCGKTTVIDAIRMMLNEDEYGRVGITSNDFYRSISKPASALGAKKIDIQGEFSNLNNNQLAAFLPWVTDFTKKEAALKLRIDNKETPRGRFKKEVWGGLSSSSIFEWDLLNSIACIYLPPLRDATSKLEAYKGSRLSRLLKKEKLTTEGEHPLEEKFASFNKDLLNDDSIKKVNKSIKKYLKESLGEFLGQDALVQFSETSFDRIVERLRIVFYPRIANATPPDFFRDISENSLGYNNILYLATVLAELENLDDELTMHKVLLIEEPEAHLHPQLQIRLIQYLKEKSKELNIQIIVTTHSPTITATCDLESINVLTQNLEQNGVKSTLLKNCDIEPKTKFFLERWLDMTRSTIFFSKGIILVEGLAEGLLMKEISKVVLTELGYLNSSIEEFGVSIVNMNGIYFSHFFQMFYEKTSSGISKDFIPIRCSGITDCDPAKEAKPTLVNPCECKNYQLHLAPKLLSNSSNCRLFSNLKTFEYDLA